MRWAFLKPWIDRLRASNAEEHTLGLTGGEPLLEWPLVRRAVEYARERPSASKTPAISLTTNGTLLDVEKARFLAAHDVALQLSLDGVREAQELRAPGTFDQLAGVLERLRRDHPSWYRKRSSIGMTLTSANLSFLSRSIAWFLARGIETIRLAPLLTHDEGWGREAEAELERQMAMVFDGCLEHHRRTGAIPLEVLRRPAEAPEFRADHAVCRVNSPEVMAVGVDGSTSRCALLLANENGGTRAGPALREWVARSDWPGLRRDRFSSWGPCRECEFIDECLVCPVASANIPGNTDFRRVPDAGCAVNRIVGRYRRRFPPVPGDADRLTGSDPLPTAMTDLAKAIGVRRD